MKILHVVRQFYPCIGGVEKFVLSLATEQIRKHNEVSVLTLNKCFADNKGIFLKEETFEGIEIKRIPFFFSKRYPIAFSCIRYLENYDIVHIHCVDFFVDYLVLLKLFHCKKIILSTHGGFFHTKWLKTLKVIYFNVITRMVLLGCDKIIASSKSDYDLFSKICKNVIQIDNGVEVVKYNALNKNIEMGTLLYLGRIDEHKRIDNLIRVLDVLLKKKFNVKLRIVGPDWGKNKDKLETLASSLGIKDSVHFLGKLADSDILVEMSKAHIFVSASEYEGFGISAVEAMSSGTICVLNNIESFRQFLKNSKFGIITDFSDYEKAAMDIEKILKIDNYTYRAWSEESKKAAKQYSWDIVSSRIDSVYESVL